MMQHISHCVPIIQIECKLWRPTTLPKLCKFIQWNSICASLRIHSPAASQQQTVAAKCACSRKSSRTNEAPRLVLGTFRSTRANFTQMSIFNHLTSNHTERPRASSQTNVAEQQQHTLKLAHTLAFVWCLVLVRAPNQTKDPWTLLPFHYGRNLTLIRNLIPHNLQNTNKEWKKKCISLTENSRVYLCMHYAR